jgi:hypothetical protein
MTEQNRDATEFEETGIKKEATQDGGPAFPVKYQSGGMTLRDYFAGQALAGFLAAHAGQGVSLPEDDWSATRAYEIADAMLAERAK